MPSVEEILNTMPLPEKLAEVKAARDREITSVIKGESDKFLVIIGPCSADNEEALIEYVAKLARLQDEVKDKSSF